MSAHFIVGHHFQWIIPKLIYFNGVILMAGGMADRFVFV